MKNKVITVRVNEETYKHLQKQARVNKCTVSEVIRWKIEMPKTLRELR